MPIHKNVGNFLFGSDEGKGARDLLKEFGLTGGGGLGESLEGGIRTDALLAGSSARRATGQQLARAGLSGSGIAQDFLGNADLVQADALRKARFGLISSRIRALLGVSQTPQQGGLVQGAISSFSSGFGQGLGEARGVAAAGGG